MATKAPAKQGFIARLLGDERGPDQGTPSHSVPMLAQWLPYRTFDRKTDIFHQTDSIAFALEVAPLVGADERTGEILAQFLSEGMPSSSRLQILSFQSPRVGQTIARYALPRYAAGGVHKKIAEHRCRFLAMGAWNSLSADGPFHVRQHRCVLSVSIKLGKGTMDELITVRESITSLLQSINVEVHRFSPVDLMALLDDLTAPAFDVSDHMEEYSQLDPIADQCIRRDVQTAVQADRLLISVEPLRAVTTLSGETEFEEIRPDRFDYRFFSVRNFPSRWAPWDGQKVIGDMFADKLRPGWVTKNIVDPAAVKPTIASVRMQDIVGEYVQAQARSNAPPEMVVQQTQAFMATLGEVLEARGADGTTVMVGEAVLSQNVPDITDDVRRSIYAKVPVPTASPMEAPAMPALIPSTAPLGQ